MIEEREAKLARARSYPYGIPDGSYTWKGGIIAPFDPAARRARTPVLAVGSNQSPEQLSRKFGEVGEIPVQRARLADFDIYYSAHITTYGAVPAMLQHAPGTSVTLSVTWLDDRQLEFMHETEIRAGNYWYGAIGEIDLTLDCGTRLREVNLYVGVHGQLMHEGEAVALAAIPAERRRPRALTTAEVLEIVRRRVSPLDSADEFVLRLVDDRGFRAACTEALAADAVSFAHPTRTMTTRAETAGKSD
jgi:hypothetical protein